MRLSSISRCDVPSCRQMWTAAVDLRTGKLIDDGYRAIHLYYQRDNMSYPIEIQLWCGVDYRFNIWSHRWAYKYENPKLGKLLYNLYKQGEIKSEDEFIEMIRKRGENNA